MKYSDLVVEWLAELGYTHCFFVAGGNIMHLLDGVRGKMTCIPVVHEVAAAIAVEYFNELSDDGAHAFALVTAGPGITNAVTGIAGAWLESRELLVLGGQVKSTDLARGDIRQRGIQEIDGVALVRSVCARAERIEEPIARQSFEELVLAGRTGRKAPVFLEFCLDAQGAPVERDSLEERGGASETAARPADESNVDAVVEKIAELVRRARRPVFLIGGGVARATALANAPLLEHAPVALMTTWNGLDRVDSNWKNYFGRPNQWGQRVSNVLIQQADLVVAFGTRLGLQQTGFNWQAFVPGGTVVQIEIDPSELEKGHPHVEHAYALDANAVLQAVLALDLGAHDEWLTFARDVVRQLPRAEAVNTHAPGFVDPYEFVIALSRLAVAQDVVIPCSSGGAYTTTMQAFGQKIGQKILSDKGLASMGYGLSAAIGAAIANPTKRTILIEGDGGFSQNLQELATVNVNRLRLKMFVYSNEGYASIRMTQRNYFNGDYLGCDTKTGLGFPDWNKLFEAFGIASLTLDRGVETAGFAEAFDSDRAAAFVVPIDPEQTYFPKISSRVTAAGSMASDPLHLMTPELPPETAASVFRYLSHAEAPATA